MENKDTSKISYFNNPITNLYPRADIHIYQAAAVLGNPYFKMETEALRMAVNAEQASLLKCRNFPYVTFSGVFKSRKDGDLIQRSRYLCVDLDHVKDWGKTWEKIKDTIDPVLMFRSPSGDGIKVVLVINPEVEHERYFYAFERYFIGKLGIRIDPACKNVSRACFLCYDPNVYLNESARVYGLPFVESFESIHQDRPRIKTPIATSRIIESTDKTLEIFNKMASWADHREPYQVGARHRHKLLVLGACNRQGVPMNEAVMLLHQRCLKTGVPTDPIEVFYDMAKRIYHLYNTPATFQI